MDIEGAEIQALERSTQTLRNLRKILVEVHDNNLERVKLILDDNNFHVIAVGPFVVGSKVNNKNTHVSNQE